MVAIPFGAHTLKHIEQRDGAPTSVSAMVATNINNDAWAIFYDVWDRRDVALVVWSNCKCNCNCNCRTIIIIEVHCPMMTMAHGFISTWWRWRHG